MPDAHQRQRPHPGRNDTRRGRRPPTPACSGPTLETTPAPSWPPAIGRMPGGRSPVVMWSSEWQSPDATIFSCTSPWRGSSMSMSRISHLPGVSRTTAPRVFIKAPLVRADINPVRARAVPITRRGPPATAECQPGAARTSSAAGVGADVQRVRAAPSSSTAVNGPDGLVVGDVAVQGDAEHAARGAGEDCGADGDHQSDEQQEATEHLGRTVAGGQEGDPADDGAGHEEARCRR